MNITLMVNREDNKVVNKRPTTVATKQGTIKAPCDIMAPVVQMAYVDGTTFNYVYIPKFARYYFVKAITVDDNNLMTISLEIDVLKTYAGDIMQSSGIVVKSESKYQMRLNDGSIHCTQDSVITHHNFPNGFRNVNKNFILVVSGGDGEPGGTGNA